MKPAFVTALAIAGLTVTQPTLGQQNAAPVPPRVLLGQLPALLDSAAIPGLAMGWLERGEVAGAAGVGIRSANDSARIDEHTVFEAASLSKPVVAYLALKLADAGRLQLDRPLTEYISIPELRVARASRITTRMVLSHTTGLQNERIGDDSLAFGFEPGERFRYSGEGFLLLQRVLERITGESLDRLARRLVFEPLGMRRSSFIWSDRFNDNAAVGHGEFNKVLRASRPTTARASSSLQTTVHDYTRFMRAIMRREGLSQRTFEQMVTPQVQVAPGIAWALGWSVETSSNGSALWHWGDNSNSGFTAFAWLHPRAQRGVVYFANSTTGLSIVRRVLGLVGGDHRAPDFMGYDTHEAVSRRRRVTSAERSAPQNPAFDPFPAGSARDYHFDLARNFFASDAIEAAARTRLLDRLALLARMAPTATRSAEALLQALQLQDSVQRAVGKHLAYWTLRASSNTADTLAPRMFTEFNAAVAPGYRAVDDAIAATPRTKIEGLLRSRPELARYAFYVDQVYRAAQRRPAAESAPAINALAPQIESWGPALFRTMLASIDFGSVMTPEGPLDLRTQGNAIRSHPDRAVRDAGYQRNQETLREHSSTFAFILTRSAEGRNALALLRGFADYPEESYAGRLLTRSDVVALLGQIAAHSEVHRTYEALRRERIKQAFGYPDVHPWDWFAPIGTAAPRFTIQQASAAVLAAARPVSEAYVAELSALLDPRNGRLDVAPGPNRVDRPGFSTGFVGYPSMFYQGRFGGFVDDVVILAHEAGHAVQNMLMDRRGVLPRYAGGPSFFTESFGVFAEFLTLRHLYRAEPDTTVKIYYLERLLDQGVGLFNNAAEAEMEQALYDSVSAGRRLNADAIESLMQKVGSKYSSRFGPNGDRELAWLQPLQFFTWPLYRMNYVYARALALAYIDLLETDPRAFAPRFNELLAGGYDAPPDAILQRAIGLGLNDPDVVRRAAAVLGKWTGELRTLYGPTR